MRFKSQIKKCEYFLLEGETDLKKAAAFLKKLRKTLRKIFRPIKKTAGTIGTALLCVFLVAVLSATIIGSAFTVYIVNLMEGTSEVVLDNLSSSYTTYIYAQDKNGEWIPYDILMSEGEKRIWASLEEIPQIVQDAFVYSEDERFYSHDGVDFQGILSAVRDIVTKQSERGASTITQQTVKNITDDRADLDDGVAAGMARKIRELYRSVQLEKHYTKDDILETYLNLVPLNNNIYGVQAASNYYFNKDVSELNLAEAACIAAITKSPTHNDPIKHPDSNLERRTYILDKMLENGAISSQEYDIAMNTELKLIGSMSYAKTENATLDASALSAYDNFDDVSSYYVDSVINQCCEIFMDKYGITWDEAYQKLRSGGYQVYTCVDLDLQKKIEEKYLDYYTFSEDGNTDIPQSAFIVMNYSGQVLAVVGGVGPKEAPLCLNRATQSTRQPGSAIKPIASYSLAVDKDLITWSTRFLDVPLLIKDSTMENGYGAWPRNYSTSGAYTSSWSKKFNFTYQCLQRSLNTTAAQIVELLTPAACFEQLYYKLHLDTLVLYKDGDTDVAPSPMSVGALTEGVTLQDMAAAYQIFGNGGYYYDSTFVTRILDNTGEVVYNHRYTGEMVLNESSAYVMNRLMETVVSGSRGTARKAKLDGVELIAKTGTTQDWNDLWFMGCTPEYVTGLWIGHDIPKEIDTKSCYGSPDMWSNIFKDIAENEEIKTFKPSSEVVTREFCTVTGLVAGENCSSTSTGYYKRTNIPGVCSGNHVEEEIPSGTTVIVANGVDTEEFEKATGSHYNYRYEIIN